MVPTLLSLAAFALPAARATEVTELAPMLRGDVEIRYDLDAERGRLMEGEQEVGRRALTDHRMTYELSFSYYTGLGIFLEMPHVVGERVRFRDASAMAFDPTEDAGTMIGTADLGDPEATVGSGLGGTWLGLRGAPFSEHLYKRGDRTSWLLEAAYRFQDKTNFWTYGPRGTRGGGEGAPAFRLKGAFSTTHHDAHPYLVVTWLRPTRLTTDIVDENDRVVAQQVQIRPASTVDLIVGSELNVYEYRDGGRVNLDFRGQFGYRSWQDIPSGIYLPDVLDASTGLIATESEHAYLQGGFGVNWRFIHYLQLNVGTDLGVTTPRRIEHFYPISTGMGTMTWGFHTELRFRVRDDLVESLKPAPAPM